MVVYSKSRSAKDFLLATAAGDGKRNKRERERREDGREEEKIEETVCRSW